jgi:hypothetical protein
MMPCAGLTERSTGTGGGVSSAFLDFLQLKQKIARKLNRMNLSFPNIVCSITVV